MIDFYERRFVKWIGVIGSVASLVGLPIAIWQIYKTRRAAEAAEVASLQTQKSILRNLLLFDVSICIKHIEEIKSSARNEKYELSLTRVNDLISQLIQIQEVLKGSNQGIQSDFDESLIKLSNIRNDFEKKLSKSSVKINTVRVNSQLDLISDSLNKLMGETKIVIEKGD